MKILLINPNQMKNPPVIPIGLEYLATSLEKHGHYVEILDLCFSESPISDIQKTLDETSYDIAGFTIRNIDSALFFNNEFYLTAFKNLVHCVKQYDIPIILGGPGFSAMPEEILDYLEADYGIIGPGEIIFPELLELLKPNKLTEKIYDGGQAGLDKGLIHKRGELIQYSKYISDEGIVGFQTHVGCNSQCPYCIEACTPVHFKEIPNIINELKFLVDKGYRHFHTCDTEFNTNLDFSIEFCRALIKQKLDMKWALYMKPAPYNEELFKVLHKSNAYLITLTVDSFEKIQTKNNYSYNDLKQLIEYCKKYEIQLAIDLLTGYPYESPDSTEKVIKYFKDNRPNTVGIGFIYRIYNHTPLADLIRSDPKLQKRLTRPYSKEESFLKPIFYTQYEQKYIENLIADDDLFKIAGLVPGVNYQLIDDS